MSLSSGDELEVADDPQYSTPAQHDGPRGEASPTVVSDDEYSSEEERDGRFYGPDSSWRHYTQNERDLAASLDQAQHNDLSIHLYNAHAWKRRHRDPDLFRTVRPWHSKSRWVQVNEDGKLPFLPHNGWTAWPLRPEDVPRSREQWGVPLTDPSEDTATHSRQQPWRPSLNLQQELQAVVLRQAKKRFHQRRWAKVGKLSVPAEARRLSSASSGSADNSAPSSIQKIRDVESGDEAKPPTSELQGDEPSTQDYHPLFTADDEAASALLKPTVQHIITKLDHLLVGLDKSRRGHRKEPGAARGRSARYESRSRSRSRAKSRPSKRKRVASNAHQLDPDVGSHDDENMTSPERSRSRSRHRTIGLRDWSEVLGVAALTGWDQAALDRTARRCAAMFGETMSMRLMPEAPANNLREELVHYNPEPILELDLLSDDESGDDDVTENTKAVVDDASANPMSYNGCPYAACPRHENPYETRWRLRAHLRRAHALSTEEIDAMEPRRDFKMLDHEDVVVKAEHDHEENVIEAPDTVHPAVTQDGFLELINVPLRREGGGRGKRKSESSSDDSK